MVHGTNLFPVLMDVQAQVAEQAGGLNPLVGILAFLVMLVILVFVHELGHLLVALWVGVRAEEFGIGYPPRMLTLFEHRGVKYTLNWLPLGGFVRFAGEGDDSLYGTGSLAEAPPWRKIPVMAAGPLMNLILAVIIFAILFGVNGYPALRGQLIADVYPGTPAAEAGFVEGDVLLELDGQPMNDRFTGITAIAAENAGQPVAAVVRRDGTETTLTVVPGPLEITRDDGTVQRMDVGLGFSYGPDIELQQLNPFQAVGVAFVHTFELVGAMINGLGQMIGGLFGANDPPPGGIAGPVGIARATGEVINTAGVSGFWNWTAILSINLFLLNLLPIPALDGSHIVFSLIEWVRGKKVPPEKEALVHGIGFATLMGLILLISVSDVWNAINGVPVLGQ
ncbi:MAG: site-2 protease family protein [Chloroflexaceae bacterium]|nr:site-2 protease family protein [Chloroflexaceae bacterium]